MENLKVVALFEYGSETGLEYIFELKRRNINLTSIICVGHEYSDRRKELLNERTGGKFVRKNFTDFFTDSQIPIYIIEKVNSVQCENLLRGLSPDLVVFEGSYIIRNKIFEIPKFGMLNVHLAILPYLRGCSCMEWSILKDYPIGVTCHFIAKDVDAGSIVNRFQLEYKKSDNYHDLRVKLLYLAAYSMGDAVDQIKNTGLTVQNAMMQNKGPWFSPMKDPEIINQMNQKLEMNLYKPRVIQDEIKLEVVDVNILTGEIKLTK
jgi:methionyl-tRNA formyltransferase